MTVGKDLWKSFGLKHFFFLWHWWIGNVMIWVENFPKVTNKRALYPKSEEILILTIKWLKISPFVFFFAMMYSDL